MYARQFRRWTFMILTSLILLSCLLLYSFISSPMNHFWGCAECSRSTSDVEAKETTSTVPGDSTTQPQQSSPPLHSPSSPAPTDHRHEPAPMVTMTTITQDVLHMLSLFETARAGASQKSFCPPLPPEFPPGASFLPCDWGIRRVPCAARLRAILVCRDASADIALQRVTAITPPAHVNFNDSCLERAVRARCYGDGLPVPRLLHYVSLSREEFPYHALLSALSALRFLKPCLLLVHGDRLPFGPAWEVLLQLVPQVVHVSREQPAAIFGHQIDMVHHRADVVRLEAMIKYGGLYLDMDQLLLKSLDDLRQSDVTLGVEFNGSRICNAMFLAKPQAEFLLRWYDAYKTFNDSWWMQHSGEIPYQMALSSPGEVKLVNTFFSPNFKNMTSLYEGTYDWRSNHGVHLYYRFNTKYFERGHIEKVNNSLGEIARLILFGSSRRCLT